MTAEVYLNVAVGGVLTGLVYGLMALGLSVIFGVVRVVNFAHGEMMTIAMYIALTLFSAFHLDPLVMLVPIAAVLFVLGYALQADLSSSLAAIVLAASPAGSAQVAPGAAGVSFGVVDRVRDG